MPAMRPDLTKAQQRALLSVYRRTPLPMSYLGFRRSVVKYLRDGCILVPWCGMWLGIENDGYTHT
jgi:hypothetical protein